MSNSNSSADCKDNTSNDQRAACQEAKNIKNVDDEASLLDQKDDSNFEITLSNDGNSNVKIGYFTRFIL